VDSALQDAPADAVLVLDGLFLHRSQLRAWWDLSVLLDVPPAVAALRCRCATATRHASEKQRLVTMRLALALRGGA
jgi:uridine kinase